MSEEARTGETVSHRVSVKCEKKSHEMRIKDWAALFQVNRRTILNWNKAFMPPAARIVVGAMRAGKITLEEAYRYADEGYLR